jgi:hypothetical protein
VLHPGYLNPETCSSPLCPSVWLSCE